MSRKEEIEEYANGMFIMSWPLKTSFIKMAEWADETTINKACKFWANVAANEEDGQISYYILSYLKDFKKYMNDEKSIE